MRLDSLGELSRLAFDLQRLLVEANEATQRGVAHAHQCERESTELLLSIRHELRTPLHAILGFAEVLLHEIDGPLAPGQREDLLAIQSAGTHLRELLDRALDFSSILAGRLSLELREFEIEALLEETARETRGLLAEKAVEVRVEATKDLVLRADRIRLRQVLTNLAGNAAKFTDRGQIVLRALERDQRIEISVEDSGRGIEASEGKRIFDPFQQSGPREAQREGVGLGLAIARRLVELHGGGLEFESRVGQGSTFRISLPLSRKPLG